MAKRRKVLGLPIGKKKPRIAPKLLAAGAGIAVVPAVAAARKLGGTLSNAREQAGQVSDIAGKASQVMEAAGGHSSTIGKVGAAIKEAAKLSGGDGAPKLSHVIEEHTDVAVPRSVAYNQWTQFEMFPAIMKGAESVEQQERDKVSWTSKIGPSRRSWQGEITEQVPDERISWKSTGGLSLRGVVTFHSLDDNLTHVLVEIEYDPRGPVEHVGNLLRVQRRRVRRDLRLFKHFVELRGEETGAWRSRIAKKSERGPSKSSSRSSDKGSRSKKSSTSRGNGAGSSSRRSRPKKSPSTKAASRSNGNGRERTSSKASRGDGGRATSERARAS